MKTTKNKILLAVAFAFSAALNIHAAYDPSIGRWASRDPFEENGKSLNLYEFCDNNSISSVDYLGEYTFTIVDLGQRPPQPPDVYGWSEAGGTSLTSWVMTTDLNSCRCGKKVIMHACWASVSYWYSSDATKTHELHHVGIWQGVWDTSGDEANGFLNQCVCYGKAYAFQAAVGAIFAAEHAEGRAENLEFDCDQYGHNEPGSTICQKASRARANANRLLDAASAAIQKANNTPCN